MTIRCRADYEHALEALGICVSARIPALLWGNPGEGKTAAIESATALGWHVETIIVTHSEPSDFAGLPVVSPEGTVEFAPPGWARRLAEVDGPAIAFFDEFSTATPALQASALRPLTHYEIGALKLPDSVAFVAAANPADVAAAGWELAAPTASRFVHLYWALPLEVYSEGLVTGSWPRLQVHETPDSYPAALAEEQVLVTGFLRARESQLSVIPRDAEARGRAFPTPRTWDYAARLSALAATVGASTEVQRLLVEGCVGEPVAHEFLAWRSRLDLPDPEELLSDVDSATLEGMRADRAYVVLQAVLAAVSRSSTAERWTAAIRLCAKVADEVGLDPAVPVVRSLVREGVRPEGARVPSEIAAFAPALALAGLLPGDA